MPLLSVLHVASELHPYVKTGGLADVMAALPEAQRRAGVDARVVLPGYPGVLAAVETEATLEVEPDLFGCGEMRIVEARLKGSSAPTFVVDAPALFVREGGPYVTPEGVEWPDNAQRFAALGWAAREIARGAAGAFRPDVVHTHDWQAGLAVAYLKLLGPSDVPCVATVHSIAYPGSYDATLVTALGLPASAYAIDGVEFYGRFSFLKAALYYADRITTVSPTYAQEIQRTGEGGGFEGLLRDRNGALVGILNGVDYAEWDPATDRHLPARYGPASLDGKDVVKAALQRAFGLSPDRNAALFGVVTRLVWQKGIDWLIEVVPWLVERGAQLVVLGSGDAPFVTALGDLAAAYPRSVAFIPGYDEALAHRIQAGSDAMLVPSRTEPCGLTQLYALRYGSPPVVRRTGGLADTVVDATPEALAAGTATGFVFDEPSAEGLRTALSRALAVHADREGWRRLQRTAMRAQFGWQHSAERYVALYRELVGI